MDPNPRKTIRSNMLFLQHQMAALKKREQKLLEEFTRLHTINENGTVEEARQANDNWSRYNWFAFPE